MNKNKLEIQLFIDTGNGFNEEESVKIPYIEGKTIYEFNISKFYSKLYAFRLDPLNESCVVSLGNCYLTDKNNNTYNLTFQLSNADIFEGIMYFVSNDPQILFLIDDNLQIDNNFNRAIFEINFYYRINKIE